MALHGVRKGGGRRRKGKEKGRRPPRKGTLPSFSLFIATRLDRVCLPAGTPIAKGGGKKTGEREGKRARRLGPCLQTYFSLRFPRPESIAGSSTSASALSAHPADREGKERKKREKGEEKIERHLATASLAASQTGTGSRRACGERGSVQADTAKGEKEEKKKKGRTREGPKACKTVRLIYVITKRSASPRRAPRSPFASNGEEKDFRDRL